MSTSTIPIRILKYCALTCVFFIVAIIGAVTVLYLTVGKEARPNIALEALLEQSLTGGFDDAVVEIKDLRFSRASWNAPITMIADKIRLYPKNAKNIEDEDAIISPSLQTGAVVFELSPLNIFKGDIILRHIKLDDLQLFAFLSEGDSYVSAFKDDTKKIDRSEAYDPSFLIPINPLDFLKYVGEVEVNNALILSFNPNTGDTTDLARMNLNMRRIEAFDQSLLTLNVFESDDTNETTPTFDLTVTSTDTQEEAEMVAYIADFNWRDLIPWIGTLNRTITETSGKVSGDLRLNYNKSTGEVSAHNFYLSSPEGRITSVVTNDQPVSYKDIVFVSNALNTSLSANLSGRDLTFNVHQDENNENAYHVNGDVPYMHAEDIAVFWPKDNNDLVTEWITQKLKDGALKDILFDFDVLRDEKDWKIGNVVANFTTENMWVRYLNALKPISNLDAKGRYENDNLFIDIDRGQVSGLSIAKGGHLEVSNLTKQGAGHLNGTLNVAGPVQGILNYLDNDIIKYKERVEIPLDNASGDARLAIKLDFPTIKDVPKEKVKVNVDGTLSNLNLPDIINGFSVSGGPYDLAASESFLKLKGKGAINKAPSDLAFDLYFSPKDGGAPFEQKFVSKGTLTPAFVGQTLGKTIGQTFAKIMATPSLYNLEFLQPVTGASSLKLDINGNNFSIGNANFQFGNGFDFKSADLTSLKLGKTRGNMSILRNANKGLDVSFSGPLINAEPFIKAREQDKNSTKKAPKNDASMAHNNFVVKTDTLLASGNMTLNNFALDLGYNNKGDFNKLSLDAVHQNAPLKIRFSGDQTSGDNLNVNIKDAGSLLKALDITSGVRGGTVLISGVPNGTYGSIKGRAEISNFTARSIPVLGRLINAISIPGLLQLLTSDGIDFSRLESDFIWTKRSDGTSVLALKNGRTRGSSLGLTFEGLYYPKTEIVDLSGNVVPLSMVNNIISAVPLIGDLLSGGKDSSLVAVNYTMKGPASDPDVFVNPLSILAPGILRRILFEGGPSNDGDPDGQQEQVPANQVAQ